MAKWKFWALLKQEWVGLKPVGGGDGHLAELRLPASRVPPGNQTQPGRGIPTTPESLHRRREGLDRHRRQRPDSRDANQPDRLFVFARPLTQFLLQLRDLLVELGDLNQRQRARLPNRARQFRIGIFFRCADEGETRPPGPAAPPGGGDSRRRADARRRESARVPDAERGRRSPRRRCPRCSSSVGSRPWRTASGRRCGTGRTRRQITRAK